MAESRAPWDVPSAWQPALEAARTGGTLLLIGAVDSGKSTLAAILAGAACEAGRAVAVVDADVGQSSLGPPTCVGMARLHEPIADLANLPAEAIDFVGAPSPTGRLLECVASACAMAAAARSAGADTLVVDTTGLIDGPSARALKAAKIRLLAPDVVVGLQAEDEVEHLLAPYRGRRRPRIVRLRRSRRVKERTREQRAARRQMKLGSYFAGGKVEEITWDNLPIDNSPWTTGEPAPGHVRAHAEERLGCEVLHAERRAAGLFLILDGQADPQGLRSLADGFGGAARAVDAASLRSLLVGLLGEQGETLGLGLLEHIDFGARRLSIYTPADVQRAKGLRLGAVQLARDGAQLGWNQPGATG